MKGLMETNCYDIEEDIIIVGTCLKNIQPGAYEELLKISKNLYEICLEEIHVNMVITKIGAMLSRCNVKKLVFATIDRSPHCIQVHYIENELRKMMNLYGVEIIHYVAVDNKLVEISKEKIKKSKCLSEN